MDLIERQAAIDVAMQYCPDDDGSCSKADVDIREMLDELESLPSAPRWTPVTERLPKPIAPSQRREWFITSNTYGGVTVTCYEFEASPFKEGWQTDMTILAWMPLPEPWKGGDNDC